MKNLTILLALMMVVTFFAPAASAMGHGGGQGMGGHGMMGDWGRNLLDWWQKWQNQREYSSPPDEQRKMIEELDEQFYRESTNLRTTIEKKSEELDALLNSPDPDIEEARALNKAIRDLRARLGKMQTNHEREVQRIDPDARSRAEYGWDPYGPAQRGYSPGMGHGGHMGSHGPSR